MCQQGHARVGDAVNRLRQHRAHQRELGQVFRRALRIGAEIEHVGVTVDARQHGADSRAADAADGLQHELAGCHQRAGVAGADASLYRTLLDQVDRHPHRGILLLFQRHRGQIVHADHFRGMLHPHTAVLLQAMFLDFSGELLPIADQHQFDAGNFVERLPRRAHGHFRAVVAAHGIESNRFLYHSSRVGNKYGRFAPPVSSVRKGRIYSSSSSTTVSAMTLRPL